MSSTLIIPGSEGCVSILLERGEWPASHELSIGAIRPNRYRHFMWFAGGKIFTADLLCDVPHQRPTFHGLIAHLERHPELWSEVVGLKQAQL